MNDNTAHIEVLRSIVLQQYGNHPGTFTMERNALEAAITALAQLRKPAAAVCARAPNGYAYRYSDGCIRHNSGREVNGSSPIQTIPYFYGPPIPDAPPIHKRADGLPAEIGESLDKLADTIAWHLDADAGKRAAQEVREDLATADDDRR